MSQRLGVPKLKSVSSSAVLQSRVAAAQRPAGCVHPGLELPGFRKGAGLCARAPLCLVLSCGWSSVADLFVLNIQRNTDNCYTVDRFVCVAPSPSLILICSSLNLSARVLLPLDRAGREGRQRLFRP